MTMDLSGERPDDDEVPREASPPEPPRPKVTDSALRAATEVPGGEIPGSSEPEIGVDSESAAPGESDGTPAVEHDSAESDEATEDGPEHVQAAEAGDETPIEVDAPVAEEASEPEPPAEDEGPPDENLMAWRAVPLTTRLEALLFAATAPLSLRRLQTLSGDVDAADVRDALASLDAHYEASGRAFGIQEIGGGYQLRTKAELSGLLARLGRKTSSEKLSPASIETLAIVAYRQPVLRVDVEKIRGVASGEVLRSLVEKGLVRIAGRADLPGSPLLYGTTPAFLEVFGLRDLRDLPSDREMLRRPV